MLLSTSHVKFYSKNVLLGVVGGVGEDPWIDTTLNPISALDHNPILHCMYKGVVEKMPPNSMHQFSVTVSQDVLLLSLPVFVSCCRPIMKCVRKLMFLSAYMATIEKTGDTYCWDVGQVVTRTRSRSHSNIFREVAEEKIDWPYLRCSKVGQMG